MDQPALAICPWCQGVRPAVAPEQSYNYVICPEHQAAMLAQYAEARRELAARRPPRRPTALRIHRAA